MAYPRYSVISGFGLLVLGACATAGPSGRGSAWDSKPKPADQRVAMSPPATTTPPTQDFSASWAGGGLAQDSLAAPASSPAAREPTVVRHTFVPKVTRIDRSSGPPAVREPVSGGVVGAEQSAEEGLSDAQIVTALETMQTADIAASEIVANRTADPRVEDFARRVQDTNQKQRERVERLAKTSGPPQSKESAVSADLRIRASQELTRAQLTPQSELDMTFLDGQVQQAQERIELIDNRFLPEAESDALREELKDARQELQQRVLEAQQLRPAAEAAENAPPNPDAVP